MLLNREYKNLSLGKQPRLHCYSDLILPLESSLESYLDSQFEEWVPYALVRIKD
jgi:hypothetical protein